jgi:hypothetical protein
MQSEQPNPEGFAPLPPPILSQDFLSVLAERQLRLRPLWVGFLLAGIDQLLRIPAGWQQPEPASTAALLHGYAALIGLLALVYYFMCVHRLTRVLQDQPDWSSEYTPAGMVWRQFIPLYGLYVLYQWTGDVESYATWRLGVTTNAGRSCFIGLFVGFALTNYSPLLPLAGIGHAIIFGALTLLYTPVRKLLTMPVPADGVAPRYDGTLGLR